MAITIGIAGSGNPGTKLVTGIFSGKSSQLETIFARKHVDTPMQAVHTHCTGGIPARRPCRKVTDTISIQITHTAD